VQILRADLLLPIELATPRAPEEVTDALVRCTSTSVHDSDAPMTRFLLATMLLAVPSLASAQQAPAPAAPGPNDYEMSCKLFHHNADGSWNATRPMTLQPAGGPIPLKPSFKFRAGMLFAGFDFAAALDKDCAH